MGILTILSMVASLIPTILQSAGVIGPSTNTLITSLLGPVATLITSIKAGQSGAQDTLSVLGALMGVLTVLQNTAIDPGKQAEVKAMLLDVKAALAAYVQSGKGIDLSVLTPIPLVP